MGHRKTFAEINLNKLSNNLNLIHSKSNKSLFCVVKANAYGHGIVEISKFLIRNPFVKYLCVSSIDEALLLRQTIPFFPIINLGYTDIEDIQECINKNITVSLPSKEWFNSLKDLPFDLSFLKIHIKVDTGMNRLGIKDLSDYTTILYESTRFNIKFEGLFSHYHSSDSMHKEASQKQLSEFKLFLESIPYDFKWVHIANSEAIIDIKDEFSNAVRCGLSMYGYSSKTKDYEPILNLYTTVTQIKTVHANESISYSATHVVRKDKQIAILPIGYADGINRKLQGKFFYINNKKVQILGRICMDQTIIEYPTDTEGHQVEIIGVNQNAADIAFHLDTIPYEILAGLNYRITRKYFLDNRLVVESSL